MQRITRTIAAVLASRRFAIGTLCFFVLESLWVACSAVYPMAFDEDFHFGLIKIYSHHWLPFLAAQPDSSSQFGAIARDPSYLYHFLMSFPYRFIELFTHSQTAQVLILRFINIALFAVGLVLFYKVLRRAGSSRLLANTALAMFVLVPIVPLLAGQINYDNLLLPLVAWTCLVVWELNEQLLAGTIQYKTIVMLVTLCLLASLVKYAFLPIAFAAVLFVSVQAWRAFRRPGRQFRAAVIAGHRALSGRAKVGLVIVLLLSGGLFAQRYGLNVVSYRTPLPTCDAVLSVDECMAYSPWARNYRYIADKLEVDDTVVAYIWTWAQGMHYRLFFTVNGPNGDFVSYPPVPLPSAAAIILTITSTTALIFYWRRVLAGHSFLVFLLLATGLYVGVLWGTNYSEFLETGRPVAINGRYLLVLLLPLAAVFGRALGLALRPWAAAAPWVAAVAIFLFLQGGGAFSFIVRSDARWDWPNPTVVHANNGARRILQPLIFEGNKFY